jgi:hypothetical protein
MIKQKKIILKVRKYFEHEAISFIRKFLDESNDLQGQGLEFLSSKLTSEMLTYIDVQCIGSLPIRLWKLKDYQIIYKKLYLKFGNFENKEIIKTPILNFINNRYQNITRFSTIAPYTFDHIEFSNMFENFKKKKKFFKNFKFQKENNTYNSTYWSS